MASLNNDGQESPSVDEVADIDRRAGADRRKRNVPVAVDRRKGERRSGERRRQIDPTTCERDYDPEEIEFMRAMDEYKREYCRPFPTWSEVLEVLKSLGYRRVAEPSKIIAKKGRGPSTAEEF
ncbi:MAG: hypothetical protein ACRC1K_12225 [Planctomycetia bacterium]